MGEKGRSYIACNWIGHSVLAVQFLGHCISCNKSQVLDLTAHFRLILSNSKLREGGGGGEGKGGRRGRKGREGNRKREPRERAAHSQIARAAGESISCARPQYPTPQSCSWGSRGPNTAAQTLGQTSSA